MDIKELRIGNYVDQPSYCGIMRVANLYYDKGYIDLMGPKHTVIGRFDLDSVSPIPLTSEWLLKLGLEENNWHSNGAIIFTGWQFEDVLFEYKNDGLVLDGVEHDPINTVHRVQNVCYAITGKELTIK